MAMYLVDKLWSSARVFYNKTQTFPTDFQLPLFALQPAISLFICHQGSTKGTELRSV